MKFFVCGDPKIKIVWLTYDEFVSETGAYIEYIEYTVESDKYTSDEDKPCRK